MLKERDPGLSFAMELFRQAVLGFTGQAMLGSKLQMRDMGHSLSTIE